MNNKVPTLTMFKYRMSELSSKDVDTVNTLHTLHHSVFQFNTILLAMSWLFHGSFSTKCHNCGRWFPTAR